jgi:PAS domain S-box-containing protein
MSEPGVPTGAIAEAIARRPIVRSTGRLVAGVITAAGLLALAGQVLGLPSLVAPIPRLPPTQPSAAVAAVILGYALWHLLAAPGGRALVSSSLALALAVVLLVGQGANVAILGPAPSVAAVVIIVAASFALVVASLAAGREVEQVVLGVVGIVLVSLTVTVIVIRAAGVLDFDAAQRISGASAQMLALGLLLGLFCLSVVWTIGLPAAEPPWWVAVGAGLSCMVIVVMVWLGLSERERGHVLGQTQLAAEAERIILLRDLDATRRSLERAAEWLASGVSPEEFQQRFPRVVRDMPGLTGGVWFRPGQEPVAAPADLDIGPLEDAWTWAGRDSAGRSVVIYWPLDAGPRRVAVIVPVCSVRCDAALVGLLEANGLFAPALADSASGFRFGIGGPAGPLRGSPTPPPDAAQWRRAVPLEVGQARWTLAAWPTRESLAHLRTDLPATILFMGLLVAILLPVALRLGQVTRRNAREVAHARLSAALERATDGVWELDLERGTATRSAGLWRYLRYDPAPATATDAWFTLVHPDDRVRVNRELQRHLAGETERFEVDYRLKAGDGSWHLIVDRGRVVDRAPDGRPIRMLGISADVTEAQAAVAGRAASESRFRAVFDSGLDLQLVLDRTGTVLEANRNALNLASGDDRRVLGRKCWETLWWQGAPAAAARLRAAVVAAAAGEARRYTEEFAGDEIVEFAVSPIADQAGAFTQLLLEGRDDTLRRRAEAALQEVSTLTTMGRLAARVAHEINNPLAGIQNAFLLIKDAVPPDHPHKGYVAAIEREIGRIGAVTRQLYETYRPDAESTLEVSVATLIGDAAALLGQLNKRTGVRIETSLTNVPAVVPLPSALLRQIVFNLVQNAIDASPPSGTVSLAATTDDGSLEIRVRDRGPGIPVELRTRIFEPFFSTKDRTMKTGGMGIGLSLVHRSVTAVGGQVLVRDAEDGGAEFVVRLPLDRGRGRNGA